VDAGLSNANNEDNMVHEEAKTVAHPIRVKHVTPGRTAERIAKIRKILVALLCCPQSRDELGNLLQVGPSGVRKYLADLRGKVELIVIDGQPHYRSTMGDEAAEGYLAKLAAQLPVRSTPALKTALSFARRDPSRHFHIMEDDEYHQVRVLRKLPALDPITAHLFNRVPGGVWA
jgi:hypothetical protein